MAKNAEVKTQNYELANTNLRLRRIKVENNIAVVPKEKKFGLAPIHQDPLYLLLLLSTSFSITNTVLMFFISGNNCECIGRQKSNIVMRSMASVSGGLSALLWLPHHLWAAPNLREYNINLVRENTQLSTLPDAELIQHTQSLEQEVYRLRIENQEIQRLRQENAQLMLQAQHSQKQESRLREEYTRLVLQVRRYQQREGGAQGIEEKQVLNPKPRYEGYCQLS
jgi:hypothetical protein